MTNVMRKNSGFTLIELLVTMAIMVGVVFAAGGGIALLTRTMDTTTQLTNDNSAARVSMMQLTREARTATRVEVEGNASVQNLCLYFADSRTALTGNVIMYVRNPITRRLTRSEGTYVTHIDGTIIKSYTSIQDTGLEIRRFSARVDYDSYSRGWLYIRIRADQDEINDSGKFDMNLMLDTKIALNRLVT